MAKLLNNLRETKLKIYKSVFVSAVVSSKLFQEKGMCIPYLYLWCMHSAGELSVPNTYALILASYYDHPNQNHSDCV